MERVKATLTQENLSFNHKLNQELQAQRHQLEMIKQKTLTEFSHLHIEQAKVIKEMYLKLIELYAATHLFTRTIRGVYEDAEKEEQERIKRVNVAFHEFKNFYLPSKLYFPRKVVDQLDHILSEFWSKSDTFARTKNYFKLRDIPRESYKHFMEELNTISEAVAEEFPPMINRIEDEFQSILGVNKENINE